MRPVSGRFRVGQNCGTNEGDQWCGSNYREKLVTLMMEAATRLTCLETRVVALRTEPVVPTGMIRLGQGHWVQGQAAALMNGYQAVALIMEYDVAALLILGPGAVIV